jgi:hypothetical protein
MIRVVLPYHLRNLAKLEGGEAAVEVAGQVTQRTVIDALAIDSLDQCGVYFGTTGGQVYVSADAGDTWQAVVHDLPSVLSVEVQTLP